MPSSDNKYSATSWGRAPYQDLQMPSGQLAQVRMPGVQQLIAIGVLDSTDSLSALIDKKHIRRVKGKPTLDGASLMSDPKNILSLMQVVDRVTAHMVVQPTVQEPFVKEHDDNGVLANRPIRDDERNPEVVYTDAIETIDKMFIFQYAVGGSADLAQFRERFQASLGSLEIGEGVSLPT
jgi:hypothetical protein